jgi:cyanate permease
MRPSPTIHTDPDPACAKRPVKVRLVNWAPWSVLKIIGWLCAKASSKHSKQKVVSKVFDNRHANTLRLYQSKIATKQIMKGSGS